MNKLTLIGSALLATTILEPIAASAYDVFSYRYDHTKQSDSPDRESRSSKEKSTAPLAAPRELTPSAAALRTGDTSDCKEISSEAAARLLSQRSDNQLRKPK